jgi:glycogen debranching enzyme
VGAEGADVRLAREILADSRLKEVLTRAEALLATGFNAGSGYREVWIRDFATFIELSCRVRPQEEIKDNLRLFFKLQGDDGNVIDGFVHRSQANIGYRYLKKESVPEYWGHKNTVETDQESSLVQAVATYARVTGDAAFLEESVEGRTVLDRLERALEYVRAHRWSAAHGLVWGATTVDWGDVQPEHEWGVELDANSHRAIDIYDNAMYLIAIRDFLVLAGPRHSSTGRWSQLADEIRSGVRRHLWDPERGKFIPHVYLEGSPFPADLDERAITYHGGTAVAIQAGLLERDEIAAALAQMRANVKLAGAGSIGLTVYPPYPAGTFKNPSMVPWSYQNGGDWDWFGGRMIQALIQSGFVEEAYVELRPMVDRILRHGGFYEWWDRENRPRGSGTFRGAAGVVGKAIVQLNAWARAHQPEGTSGRQ